MNASTGNLRHAERDDLVRYAQGELPEEQMAALEDHFADCPTCAARSVAMRRLENIFENLPHRMMAFEAQAAVSPREGIAEKVWAALGGSAGAVPGLIEALGLRDAVAGLEVSTYSWLRSALPDPSRAGYRGAPPLLTRAHSPKFTVTRRAVNGPIEVRLEDWHAGRPLPICTLIPKDKANSFAPRRLEWTRTKNEFRAALDAPPGEYIVVLSEPEAPGGNG